VDYYWEAYSDIVTTEAISVATSSITVTVIIQGLSVLEDD
jgi:hypothetical protein